jgi:hypothetical protein
VGEPSPQRQTDTPARQLKKIALIPRKRLEYSECNGSCMIQSCSERSTRGSRLVTRTIVRMKPVCRRLECKKLGHNMQMRRGQVISSLANSPSTKNLPVQCRRRHMPWRSSQKCKWPRIWRLGREWIAEVAFGSVGNPKQKSYDGFMSDFGGREEW